MVKQKKKVEKSAIQNTSLVQNPFGSLKALVDRNNLPSNRSGQKASQEKKEAAADNQPDEQLFLEAMEGVNPIARENIAAENPGRKKTEKPGYVSQDEALSRLARLVSRGEGFVVSDTPEYVEGTGYNVHQEFAQRLHRGDYSIQAHIDLHGLNVESAREAFETFMQASFNAGKSGVLIIHGRGLSSPGEAILKQKVREWLGQSYWRKRVVAYASAQSYDGGAGATYVLFRSRPVTKKSGRSRAGR